MMNPRSRPIVYLAARYSRREELQGYAAALEELGAASVPARWLREPHDWDGSTSPEQLKLAQQYALDDAQDIERAHAVVVFTEPEGTYRRGGSLVELGMALAMRKQVFVVGPAVNVFCTLPYVWRVATWPECVAAIVNWKGQAEAAVARRRLVLPS